MKNKKIPGDTFWERVRGNIVRAMNRGDHHTAEFLQAGLQRRKNRRNQRSEFFKTYFDMLDDRAAEQFRRNGGFQHGRSH